MEFRLRLVDDATAELDLAVGYLEGERDGLGVEFLLGFDEATDLMLEQPRSGTPVRLDTPWELRRFQVGRFRDAIFFAVANDELVVFAISHHKRAPSYWARRLDAL